MISVELFDAQSEFSTAAQQQIVLDTLKSILDSAHFSKSPRSRALLEFAVRNALQGNSTNLKERTVGIEVFGRPADYDTNSDPVVRTAAVEVRRRIVQYFSDHPETPIRIDIPAGSYKAAIHFRTQPDPHGSFQDSPTQTSIDTGPAYPQPRIVEELRGRENSSLAATAPNAAPRRWSMRMALGIAAVLVLAGAGFVIWQHQGDRALREFWGPILEGSEQPLLLMGRTVGPGGPDTSSDPTTPAANGTGGPRTLTLDDAIAAAKICAVLREFQRDCKMEPGKLAGGDEIRNKSFVVVGGLGSRWTQQLLAFLPYHPRSGTVIQPDARGTVSIMERQPAGDVPLWKFDKSAPTTQFGKDYAIVARFRSDATGGLAIVVAGLGPQGTNAAGQFVSSPEKLRDLLARAPKGWKGINFESILQIDLVQGTASNTEVIATDFW